MKKTSTKMTTAQFAKLHEVNKRTLHYYDEIGLFSPSEKGENRYRYYDSAQSIEFEYILMLKELHMSIEEIKAYVNAPNAEHFIRIVDEKSKDIDDQIRKLKQTKKLLQMKKEQVMFSEQDIDMRIEVVSCDREYLMTIPFSFEDHPLSEVFSMIKEAWGIEQCRTGVGSYISVEKLQQHNFEDYDGLYAPAISSKKGHTMRKPKGQYLCGYCKGTWDRLPLLYEKMLSFAKEHHLTLTGYAFERGYNDFVIQDDNEYVTQIMIAIA